MQKQKGFHVRVVRYRSAKPFTPVRIWLEPPGPPLKSLTLKSATFSLWLYAGEIERECEQYEWGGVPSGAPPHQIVFEVRIISQPVCDLR